MSVDLPSSTLPQVMKRSSDLCSCARRYSLMSLAMRSETCAIILAPIRQLSGAIPREGEAPAEPEAPEGLSPINHVAGAPGSAGASPSRYIAFAMNSIPGQFTDHALIRPRLRTLSQSCTLWV